MLKAALILVVLSTMVPLTAGCADSSAEQDGGPKQAATPVKTEAVRQESVRRTLDVVGTLAAEDQVTISSEVDGVVRRVLADLGDRVTSGQPLVELDREKLQYNLDQQRAAHARSLTKYGGSDPEDLPRVENTPDVRRAAAELAQAQQAFERASELHKRQLIAQQMLDDADTTTTPAVPPVPASGASNSKFSNVTPVVSPFTVSGLPIAGCTLARFAAA